MSSRAGAASSRVHGCLPPAAVRGHQCSSLESSLQAVWVFNVSPGASVVAGRPRHPLGSGPGSITREEPDGLRRSATKRSNPPLNWGARLGGNCLSVCHWQPSAAASVLRWSPAFRLSWLSPSARGLPLPRCAPATPFHLRRSATKSSPPPTHVGGSPREDAARALCS
jgi:hypothetical protein